MTELLVYIDKQYRKANS